MRDVLLLLSPEHDLRTLAIYLRAAELRGDMGLYQTLLQTPEEFTYAYVVEFNSTVGAQGLTAEEADQLVVYRFADIPRYRQIEYADGRTYPHRRSLTSRRA